MTKHKQKPIHRPSRLSFVAGWAAAFIGAFCILMIVSAFVNRLAETTGSYSLYNVYSGLWSLIFAGTLAVLQFLWLRRSWGISLRLWLPLALLSLFVGELAFQIFDANVVYPFPPKLYSDGRAMPEPEHIMQLKFTLYQTVRWFLIWSTPLIFQWLALRKRFRIHGLWLLAAVAHAPLTFVITEHGGILVQALKLFDKMTEYSLIRDAQPLGSIAAILDWTIPTVIMGLVLYWLLTQGEKIKTDQIRAHQR